MKAWWVTLMMVIAAACASGRGGDGPSGGQHDAPAGPPTDGTPVADAAIDGAIDAPIDGSGGGGTGLDPDLSLPDPGGQVCDEPGRLGLPECPPVHVCRFFTSTEGRCESCTGCGNLNAACSATSDCDILFECYKNRCTNFCTLGSGECGPPADCINIGHATRGVCRV
jgi:hypothetical protein